MPEPQIRLELVSFGSGDTALDGLLYHPTGDPRGGVLVFHGNTTNFYSGPSRFLSPALARAGFTVLAFNRRGHDIVTTLPGKRAGGGAFQTAAEGIADNDRAAEFLAARGFDRPIVVGHSNGGMLGSQFAVDHPEARALVLLSAHAGGPLTYLRGCTAGEMGAGDADGLLERARAMVADGRGDELMLMPGWWFAITPNSLIDRHTNTPDLLENAVDISCPSLFVVGGLENPEIYPAEGFARLAAGPSTAVIVPDGDHWYRGVEDTVADTVVSWLDDTV